MNPHRLMFWGLTSTIYGEFGAASGWVDVHYQLDGSVYVRTSLAPRHLPLPKNWTV